jgi:hypothetical protein
MQNPIHRRPSLQVLLRGLLCLIALGLGGCGSEGAESAGIASSRLQESTSYELSGIVYGSGTPLGQATVEAILSTSGSVVASVTADDAGRYSLSLPAGTYDLRVTPPPASGFAVQTARGIVVEDGAVQHDVILLRSEGAKLKGTVTGYQGGAVPNATVSLSSMSSGQRIGSITTDENGQFAINLADGSYDVYISAYSSANAPQSMQLSMSNVQVAGATTLDVPLPVVALDGFVSDPNDAAVSGTSVYLSDYGNEVNRSWSSSSSVATGSDGRYQFLAFTGSGNFDVRPPAASKLGPTVASVSITEDAAFDFKLSALDASLSGKVTGYQGGAVANATVSLSSMSSGQRIGSTTTDENGQFAINLADGSYDVYISAYSSANAPQSMQLSMSNVQVAGATTLDVPLPVTAVTGEVTDANGAPVSGTSIYLSNYGNEVNRSWSSSSSVTTGADGHYLLLSLTGSASFDVRPPVASSFAPASLTTTLTSAPLGQTVLLARNDVVPPAIVTGPTVIHLSDTSVSIRWTTNEAADGHVSYGIGKLDQGADQATLGIFHDVTLVNLVPSSVYEYRVASTDTQGNGPTQSNVLTFRTQDPPGDITAPLIVAGPVVAYVSDTMAIITWETDEPASSRLDFGTTTALGSSTSDGTGAFLRDHSLLLTGLSPNTDYFARAVSSDPDGNGPTLSELVTFRTNATPDVAAPIIVSGPTVASSTDVSLTIVWTTDEPATSGVSFKHGTQFDLVSDDMLVVDHVITLSGLDAETHYQITVSSKDAASNGPTLGGPIEGITQGTPDTTPPALSNVTVSQVTESSAVVTWTSDEPATSGVEFGLGPNALDGVVADVALVTEHQVLLSGLAAGQAYYLIASSEDVSGNRKSSEIVSFATLRGPSPGDTDGDGVADTADKCPGTVHGSRVDANGCSIADLCPCAPRRGKAWRNHKAYVSCVESAVTSFVKSGILNRKTGRTLVAAANCSTCGLGR